MKKVNNSMFLGKKVFVLILELESKIVTI